ncbi:hypothetical protein ACOSQ2_003422 [Xanthoceras sorbifolium]
MQRGLGSGVQCRCDGGNKTGSRQDQLQRGGDSFEMMWLRCKESRLGATSMGGEFLYLNLLIAALGWWCWLANRVKTTE